MITGIIEKAKRLIGNLKRGKSRPIYLLLVLVFFVFMGIGIIRVENIYSSTIDNGLVGYWKIDEGTGTIAADTSGNGNNGTLINSPLWVEGQVGKALSFDGVNDYVNCGNSPGLNLTNAISIAAWVNPKVYAFCGGIVSKGIWGAPSPYSSYALDTKVGGYFQFCLAWGQETVVSKQHSTNTWYHVVSTWDGTTAKIYVNGILENQALHTGTLNVNNGILAIGVDHPGGVEYFNGSIDEVRIYNRALSESEILTIYQDLNVGTNPTAPVVLDPNGGETIDKFCTINWNKASDNEQTEPELKYEIEFSTNASDSNPIWNSIVTLAQNVTTANGIGSYTWNAQQLPSGTSYKIRVRAYDGTTYGPYDYSDNVFTLRHIQIIISSNTTWSSGIYTCDDVQITNNAVLTFIGQVILDAANLTIDTGASLSADNNGYPAGQGPGAGSKDYAACGGGGYGGKGGKGWGAAYGGGTYGSALGPIDFGSGSGNPENTGMPGGGKIRLNIRETLRVDGKITAGATNGVGSGGSIYITTNVLSGAGYIIANGGNATAYRVGGGGGGRIAVYYRNSTFPLANAMAKGGTSVGEQPGENGTVGLFDGNNNLYIAQSWRFEQNDSPINYNKIVITNGASVTNSGNVNINTNELIIDSGAKLNLTGTGTTLNVVSPVVLGGGSSLTFKGQTLTLTSLKVTGASNLNLGGNATANLDNFILENNSSLTFTDNPIFNVPSLTVNSGSVLTLCGTETLNIANNSITVTGANSKLTSVQGSKISLNLVNLTIDTEASISADGKGYLAGQGPGAGGKDYAACGGGGYGGKGGKGWGAAYGGGTYGSALEPVDLGSGSGDPENTGVPGGGAIRLNIRDTLRVDGKITAGATNGVGSGGSIYITTNVLSGTGYIIANGGNATAYRVGGGGGGRIAVYYRNSTFPQGNVMSKGGISVGEQPGEDGTVVYNVFNNPPTAPVITSPNGGENIDESCTITWNKATDNEQSESQLIYEIDYSTNASDTSIIWSNLVALGQNITTTNGVGSYIWNTEQLPIGANYKIRIRAYDESVYGLYDESDNVFAIQHDPPSAPSTSINEGDYTNKTSVNLTLSCLKAKEMMISENADFTNAIWETFTTTKVWTLTDGDCLKTIYVKFRNGAGTTDSVNDAITLDTVAPTAVVTISGESPLKEGVYVISLTASERLQSCPELLLTPAGKTSLRLGLSSADNITWVGYLLVTRTTGDGPGTITFKGSDPSGNTGTILTSGSSFSIDAANIIFTKSSFQFALNTASEGQFIMEIQNVDDQPHTASIRIVNPYTDLYVTLTGTNNNFTIASGEKKDIPVYINSADALQSTYNLSAEAVTEDGSVISCSLIVVLISDPKPDLAVTSNDISVADSVSLNENVEFKTDIWNMGTSVASNVKVRFLNYDTVIGELIIPAISTNIRNTVVFQTSFTSGDFQLFRVIVDPDNEIGEISEQNNEASKLILTGGQAAFMSGKMEVIAEGLAANGQIAATGRATYKINYNNMDLTWPVKGAFVSFLGGSVGFRISPTPPFVGFAGATGGFGWTDPNGEFLVLAPGSLSKSWSKTIGCVIVTDYSITGWTAFDIPDFSTVAPGVVDNTGQPFSGTIEASIKDAKTAVANSSNEVTYYFIPEPFVHSKGIALYPSVDDVDMVAYVGNFSLAQAKDTKVKFSAIHPVYGIIDLGEKMVDIPGLIGVDVEAPKRLIGGDGIYIMQVSIEQPEDEILQDNEATRLFARNLNNRLWVSIANPTTQVPPAYYNSSYPFPMHIVVKDTNGNIVPSAQLDTLVLQVMQNNMVKDLVPLIVHGVIKGDVVAVNDGYDVTWFPGNGLSGKIALRVLAQASTGDNSQDELVINIVDNIKPQFTAQILPSIAKADSTVEMTIKANELLLNDQLSIEVKGADGTIIPFQSPPAVIFGSIYKGTLATFPDNMADGDVSVTISGTDISGNLGTGNVKFTFDSIAPITSIEVGEPKYSKEGNIYISSFTVISFSSTDNYSGIQVVQVSVDNGPFMNYEQALKISENGEHNLICRAIDNAGNIETDKVFKLFIDNAPPEATLSPSAPLYNDGQQNYAPLEYEYIFGTISSLSGINRIMASIDGNDFAEIASTFKFTSEGPHQIVYHAVNNLGYIGLDSSFSVFVDSTPPVTAAVLTGPQTTIGGIIYLSLGAAFSLSAEDLCSGLSLPGSGVGLSEYRLNGVDWLQYTDPVILNDAGINTIQYKSKDKVGNIEALKEIKIAFDNIAPESYIGFSFPSLAVEGNWLVTSQTRISLSAVDPIMNSMASGLKQIYYQIGNEGEYGPYTDAFGITGMNGSYLISYYSEDNAGNSEAVKTAQVILDNAPPETTFTPGAPLYNDGSNNYASAGWQCSLAAIDVLSGLKQIQIIIDQNEPIIYADSITFTTAGLHSLKYAAVDNLGNWEQEHTFSIIIDTAAPQTSIELGVPSIQEQDHWLITAHTEIKLNSADTVVDSLASGLTQIYYRVISDDPEAAFTLYTDTFTVNGSTEVQAIEYYALDNVGNTETVKTLKVVLDNTPPVINITTPEDDCIINVSTMTIYGLANDTHFAEYKLEYGFGENPAVWTLLSSSTEPVVEATKLAGINNTQFPNTYALRLTAVDTLGNSNSITNVIYFKEPELILTFGDKGKTDGQLRNPGDIVMDADGNIFVADTNNNRIQKFDSQGNVILVIGSKGKKDGEFEKPQGIAVTLDGSIYVADTNNHRIQKFDKEGKFVMKFGTKSKDPADQADMHKPVDIAVAGNGDIYVADRAENRIQKFNSAGEFIMVIGSIVADNSADIDRPLGISLDQEGNLYVADTRNNRIQKFDSEGNVLWQIGGKGQDLFKRPNDVFVDETGNIYVADTNHDRIVKLSQYGEVLLVVKERLVEEVNKKGEKIQKKEALFNKPQSLAIDRTGAYLYVADTNNNRIVKLAVRNISSLAVTIKPAIINEYALADKPFALGNIYSWPNPAKNGRKPNLHIEVGYADKVRIDIYNIAGELVQTAELNGDPANVNGKDVYEYIWDITDIASGVYIYHIVAERSGYDQLKITKKLAVIK